MTRGRWYARPEGDGLVLRKSPRLASWNKATDHDQVQLRQYLEDTAELVAPAFIDGLFPYRLGLTGRISRRFDCLN